MELLFLNTCCFTVYLSILNSNGNFLSFTRFYTNHKIHLKHVNFTSSCPLNETEHLPCILRNLSLVLSAVRNVIVVKPLHLCSTTECHFMIHTATEQLNNQCGCMRRGFDGTRDSCKIHLTLNEDLTGLMPDNVITAETGCVHVQACVGVSE